MQTVSIGDNLHDMSKPTFWENDEYHQFVLDAEMLPYNHFSVNQSNLRNRLKNCSDLSQIKDTCVRL